MHRTRYNVRNLTIVVNDHERTGLALELSQQQQAARAQKSTTICTRNGCTLCTVVHMEVLQHCPLLRRQPNRPKVLFRSHICAPDALSPRIARAYQRRRRLSRVHTRTDTLHAISPWPPLGRQHTDTHTHTHVT